MLKLALLLSLPLLGVIVLVSITISVLHGGDSGPGCLDRPRPQAVVVASSCWRCWGRGCLDKLVGLRASRCRAARSLTASIKFH